jgi:hypothetical protein
MSLPHAAPCSPVVLPKLNNEELGSAVATPALAIIIQCYAAYALEASGKESWRRGVVRVQAMCVVG